MTTRWWASLALFISSYFPLVPILAVRDWDTNTGWFDHSTVLSIAAAVCVAATLLTICIVRSIKTGVEVTIETVRDRSNDVVNYTIPYVVSFIGLNIGNFRDLIAFSLFMLLLFLLAVKTRSLFVNPVLLFFGYALYDAEFVDHGVRKANVILAKRGLTRGDSCRVEPLSPYLLIAHSPM